MITRWSRAGQGEHGPRLAGAGGIAGALSRLRSGSRPASLDGSSSVLTTPEGSAPAVVVSCAAEMDLTNVAELTKALRTACRAGRVVVVDMSRTVFCDAAAVRALVDAHQRAIASSGELRVVVASPALTRILAVMGVDHLFRIVSSLPEALSAGSEANSELPLTRRSGGEVTARPVGERRGTKTSESAAERGVCHVGNLPE